MTKTIKKELSLIDSLCYLDESNPFYKERASELEKLKKPSRKQEAWRYFPLKSINTLPKDKGEKEHDKKIWATSVIC